MDKINILIINGSASYIEWLSEQSLYTGEWPGCTFVDNLSDADLVVFTGGQDITPELYGQKKHYSTISNIYRDRYEITLAKDAIEHRVPLLGICRGAQLLTVVAGGQLIQDVQGHGSLHNILVSGVSLPLPITSTHHQMMNPYVLDTKKYTVLGKSLKKRSDTYITFPKDDQVPIARDCIVGKHGLSYSIEPEIVHYNEIKALCVQGHPEKLLPESQARRTVRALIISLITNNIFT